MGILLNPKSVAAGIARPAESGPRRKNPNYTRIAAAENHTLRT